MRALRRRRGGPCPLRRRGRRADGRGGLAEPLSARRHRGHGAPRGAAEGAPGAAASARDGADIERQRPAALVSIDSWGFSGRVAKRLKAAGSRTPRIHYVAPMVWAWRPGRARVLARLLDHLLCLLPNEPAYFEAVGLGATHVGHPVIESGAERGDGAGFRRRHGIDGRVRRFSACCPGAGPARSLASCRSSGSPFVGCGRVPRPARGDPDRRHRRRAGGARGRRLDGVVVRGRRRSTTRSPPRTSRSPLRVRWRWSWLWPECPRSSPTAWLPSPPRSPDACSRSGT